MPPPFIVSTCMASLILAAFSTYTFWKGQPSTAKKNRLRQKLPHNLVGWRLPGNDPDVEWKALEEVFREGGLDLWPFDHNYYRSRPPNKADMLSSGYSYIAGHRADPTGPGSLAMLNYFQSMNPNNRPARTREGHDVVVRIIVIGEEGHDHLRILRKIASGVNSMYANNHVLPMLAEFQFEDIVFGILPKVGGTLEALYGFWALNSAGDVVEVIMQMLEGLAFIHKLNIAHRDAFKDNFVMQYQPESLRTMTISPSRPRVYIIDFEAAIEFPSECSSEEQVVTGYPLGGSATDIETYSRPCPPECATGEPYSPYKLDIWQLGRSLTDVRSTFSDIDQVLDDMVDPEWNKRPSAEEALNRIRAVVNSIPPNALLIKPWMEKNWLEDGSDDEVTENEQEEHELPSGCDS